MALPSITPLKSLPPNGKRRGGQPGNSNARKTGVYSVHHPNSLSQINDQLNALNYSIRAGALSPSQTLVQSAAVIRQLHKIESKTKGTDQTLAIADLLIKTVKIRQQIYNLLIPLKLKERTLAVIAHNPFSYIERHFQAQGISRDADSFFFVSKLSARNSPDSTFGSGAVIPPSPAVRRGVGGEVDFLPLQISSSIWGGNEGGVESKTNYATDLTDEQWAILAPLIPPDPHLDHLSGTPPTIIAANRWQFTQYKPDSDFNDFLIHEEHARVISKFPALQTPPPPPAKKRGRPRQQIHPRLLLNAIFWKLSTGQTWENLPFDFPPMRLCRKYYRRLFFSGRLYTILLALYNHLHLEENIDIYKLYEQGIFTTTPGQAIALKPGTPPTNNHYMALLFMQLAREAYSYLDRLQKEKNRFYKVLPVFKGDGKLSDAFLPVQEHIPTFEPLELSRAAKQYSKNERMQRKLSRIVAQNIKK